MDDRTGLRQSIDETPNGVLAAGEQLARAVRVVAQRRKPQVGTSAEKNRRSHHPPPRTRRRDRKGLAMQFEQREQLASDRVGERAPRLERLTRELLLHCPVRLDLDVARRRIPELAQPRRHSGRARRTSPPLQNEGATRLVEPPLGADLAARVAAIEAEIQAVFRSGSPGLRRRWIRLPSLTISST
jgi:hypothetical protein